MIVQVDPGSAVPVYEQLRTQIERLIVSGQLAPGSRLPTIRDLSTDLGLARGTVNRVYDELGRAGLVETLGRHGTRVLGASARTVRTGDLAAAADALAVVARQLGVDDAGAHAALGSALGRVPPDG